MKTMNERIRELAEQAGINLPDDSVYNGHIYKNAIKRFAGLVAQECIYIIQMKIPRNGKTPENLRSYEHVKDIRDRFGVDQ